MELEVLDFFEHHKVFLSKMRLMSRTLGSLDDVR